MTEVPAEMGRIDGVDYECCAAQGLGAVTFFCAGRMRLSKKTGLLECTKCKRVAEPEPEETESS